MLDDKKTLAANTDYTVSQSGLTVTFDIKPASLIGYKEVEVYFDTILNSEAAIATDIPNTSELEYSNTATSTYKIKSEEPTVHTGEYKFKKKDAKGNPIKGVKFAVYSNEESAKNGTNAIMTAESNADGIVPFKGLAYGKFAKRIIKWIALGVVLTGIVALAVVAGMYTYIGRWLFDSVVNLGVGDTVEVTTYFGSLKYTVKKVMDKSPKDGDIMFIEKGKDKLTLVTCIQGGAARRVVVCER